MTPRERSALFKMLESERVEVLRNHRDTVTLVMPDNALTSMPENDPFMAYRVPVFVKQVMPGEPAAKAGLREGDRIIAVGDSRHPCLYRTRSSLDGIVGGKTVPHDPSARH